MIQCANTGFCVGVNCAAILIGEKEKIPLMCYKMYVSHGSFKILIDYVLNCVRNNFFSTLFFP